MPPLLVNADRSLPSSVARGHRLAWAQHPPSAAPSSLAEGSLWIAPEFAGELSAAGLDRFSDLWQTTSGQVLRALADRENRRLEWPRLPVGCPPRAAYLKKHIARRRRSGRRPWLRSTLGPSAAAVEAQAISRLESAGIPTVRLVAWGQGHDAEGWPASLILIEELAGFTQLDHFLRQRFACRDPLRATRRHAALGELAGTVAQLTRQLHQAGYCHRDLYGCHYFVRESAAGFEVRLIDLQRLRPLGWLPRRWIVKDLAQLAYSMPRDRVSDTLCLAWLRQYLGERRLSRRGRRWARSILARQHQMQRNLGWHP